ncbi:hypothetical protein M9458_019041, partial [Cirrhinus mrigala]
KRSEWLVFSFKGARSTPRPRIGASAAHILERGQRGVVGDLLKLEGVALNPSPAKP